MRSRLFTCERTVCSEMNSRLAISSVREVLVEQQQHLELAGRDRLGDRIGHAGVRGALADLLEQAAGNRAGERGLTLGDAVQELDDPLGRLRLEQVAGGPAPDRGEQVLLGARSGQHDDFALGRRFAQARQGSEAVELGHREVEQHEVGLELPGDSIAS